MQLAQLNIADGLYAPDAPQMEGFTDNIDRINALADCSAGFIWRLKDEGDIDGALSLRIDGEGEHVLVNMSVWTDIQSLFAFVYKTAHAKIMHGRRNWFAQMSNAHMVMWWVKDGHRPNLDEARMKLSKIRRDGASFEAFNFQKPFAQDGKTLTIKHRSITRPSLNKREQDGHA